MTFEEFAAARLGAAVRFAAVLAGSGNWAAPGPAAYRRTARR
jgi:hypothetical protein